jgi:hypothetical protein
MIFRSSTDEITTHIRYVALLGISYHIKVVSCLGTAKAFRPSTENNTHVVKSAVFPMHVVPFSCSDRVATFTISYTAATISDTDTSTITKKDSSQCLSPSRKTMFVPDSHDAREAPVVEKHK